MPIPEHTLLFLAALATFCSVGPFARFERELDNGERVPDRMTQTLLGGLAAVIWGMVGLSSYDVVIGESVSESARIMPMVVLGLGLAAIMSLVAIWRLIQVLRNETSSTGTADEFSL